MARHKKHRRKSSRRRHRIGAVDAKGVLSKIAGIGIGFFAGRMLTTKMGATMNPKLVAAIPIAVGVILPKYMKGDFGGSLGAGLVASGIYGELQSFNVLAGVGAVPGSYAQIATNSGYNPKAASTVGADRPFMKNTVGFLNGIPERELRTIGMLMEE